MLGFDLDKWDEIIATLTRNKTRSLLTAFGVFWGIFMLVFLMGGSKGVQQLTSKNFAGFATNSGFLISGSTEEAYKGFRKGRTWDLTTDDVKRVKQMVPEIDIATPALMATNSRLTWKTKHTSCAVKGVYPIYTNIETPDMQIGRFINDIDIKQQRKVCVIGRKLYEALFEKGTDPCGKYVRVDSIYFEVVGVNYSLSDMSLGASAEESVTLPFTTMQKMYNMGNKIHILCVTAKPGYKMSELQPKMEQTIKRAHYISPTDKQAVIMVNAEAMFGMVDNLFSGIRMLSWLVGLGTLLAGAIGVSNIMMVTVRERTVEIGIRRAIGATPRQILTQILTESIVLTAISGLAGITFAVLLLQGLETVVAQFNTGIHFQISFWLAVGTTLLVMALGVVAGLAPAFRAMSIKAIDAIRDE